MKTGAQLCGKKLTRQTSIMKIRTYERYDQRLYNHDWCTLQKHRFGEQILKYQNERAPLEAKEKSSSDSSKAALRSPAGNELIIGLYLRGRTSQK